MSAHKRSGGFAQAAGEGALSKFLRTGRGVGRATVFLDFDDVLCLNAPYGGGHFRHAERPADLFERLWHPPAVAVLREVCERYEPRLVVTSTWLRFLTEDSARRLFMMTGLEPVAKAMHPAWEAPSIFGKSRHDAIQAWLLEHYKGEPIAVIDDELSGTGLKNSALDKAGCVVLCEENIGLHRGHLPLLAKALEGIPALSRVID